MKFGGYLRIPLYLIRTERGLESVLSQTLRIIRLKLNGSPTVLWTGNGYHIYQPIDALDLTIKKRKDTKFTESLR